MGSKKANGDLSTRVLIEIRDEMRLMRHDLDGLRAEVVTLQERQTQTEVRLASELVAVAKAVTDVRDLLREQRTFAPRIEDHEKRIAILEAKRTG